MDQAAKVLGLAKGWQSWSEVSNHAVPPSENSVLDGWPLSAHSDVQHSDKGRKVSPMPRCRLRDPMTMTDQIHLRLLRPH